MENKEIEQAILSIALQYDSKDSKERVLIFKTLEYDHFTGINKIIFREMKKLYNNNDPFDYNILLSVLGKDYLLSIVELSNTLYSVLGLKKYIDILIEDFQRQKAKQQLNILLEKINSKELMPDDLQNELLEASKIFQSRNSRFKSFTMEQGLTDTIEELKKPANYFKTGYRCLDQYLNIEQSNFIIIGGRPGTGKTTFATNIMVEMSKKHKVLFFSLETSYKKIYQKILASQTDINIGKMINRSLEEHDFCKFEDFKRNFKNCRYELIEASGMSVNDIAAESMRRKADIIFIDYLQLINESAKKLYEKVTKISLDLHTFAQKEKIAVVALSQIKRIEPEFRRPTMQDLKESGQIEADADAILLIYEPKGQKGKEIQDREVIVVKNKEGIPDIINFNFFGRTQKFIES